MTVTVLRRQLLAAGLSLVLLTVSGRAEPLAATEGTPDVASWTRREIARALEGRLKAFRAAVDGGDLGTALRRQRELLEAAGEAAAALGQDASPPAAALLEAVATTVQAAAGDQGSLAAAEAELRLADDDLARPSQRAAPAAPAPDARAVLQRMSEDVPQFQRALRDGDLREALKLQAELVNDLSVAESAFERVGTEQGRRVRLALSDLRAGLQGDPGRLGVAAAALAELRPPRRTRYSPTIVSDEVIPS